MLRTITEDDLDSGDLIDADEFIGMCIEGNLIDYDGFGNLVFDDQIDDRTEISPSDYETITDDVTHILWFNR